jgi:hypothetical protein
MGAVLGLAVVGVSQYAVNLTFIDHSQVRARPQDEF